MKLCGIYKITSPTGKIYVGQSYNIQLRFKNYEKGKCKEQPKLFESLFYYGFKNHIFEIIEYCNKINLNNKERYWQDYYNVLGFNGLNLLLEKSDTYKRKVSEETKIKISKALKGRPALNAKKIINVKTEKVYVSIKQCAIINNLNYSTLKRTIANNSNKYYKYYEVI